MYAAAICLLALQAAGTDLPPLDGDGAAPPPQLAERGAADATPARLDQIVAMPAHQPAWLSADAVKLAVGEAAATPIVTPASTWPVHAFGAANPYLKFDRAFDEARIPDCLHQDALKFQPPALGFLGITDETALLFVAVAKLRGKCT